MWEFWSEQVILYPFFGMLHTELWFGVFFFFNDCDFGKILNILFF